MLTVKQRIEAARKVVEKEHPDLLADLDLYEAKRPDDGLICWMNGQKLILDAFLRRTIKNDAYLFTAIGLLNRFALWVSVSDPALASDAKKDRDDIEVEDCKHKTWRFASSEEICREMSADLEKLGLLELQITLMYFVRIVSLSHKQLRKLDQWVQKREEYYYGKYLRERID